MVDVRFRHERVAATDQRCARLFSQDLVARRRDQPMRLPQKLRRHELHVVPDRLKLVLAVRNPGAVAQEALHVGPLNNPVLGDFGTGPRNAVRADLRRAESGESGAHAANPARPSRQDR